MFNPCGGRTAQGISETQVNSRQRFIYGGDLESDDYGFSFLNITYQLRAV